jgi:hypothetical protein
LQFGFLSASRDLHIGDDRGTIEQVIQHQQGINQHQNGVREPAIVSRRVRECFDGTNDIIPEVADGSSGEAGESGNLDRGMTPHGPSEMVERGNVGLDDLPA